MQADKEWETWETTFLKNHTQNVLEKLFADPFLKNQNWTVSGSINIPEFYKVYFYCLTISGWSKYIEFKLQTICFYLI